MYEWCKNRNTRKCAKCIRKNDCLSGSNPTIIPPPSIKADISECRVFVLEHLFSMKIAYQNNSDTAMGSAIKEYIMSERFEQLYGALDYEYDIDVFRKAMLSGKRSQTKRDNC